MCWNNITESWKGRPCSVCDGLIFRNSSIWDKNSSEREIQNRLAGLIVGTGKTDTPYGYSAFRQRRFQKMQEKYDVTGMTCAACQARVQKSVACLNGVQECNVNLLKNSIEQTKVLR